MFEVFDRAVIEAARKRYDERCADRIEEMRSATAGGEATAINQLDELPRYVNRFVQLKRPELAAELLQDTSEGRPPQRSALERIIEQNELMAASFFARGLAAARAVGRVVVRNSAGQTRGYGTGFMISPRLMMTNNHVLNSAVSADLSLIEFDYALGIDGLPMIPSRFQLDPSVFFETSVPLDFTIVGVEPVNADGEEVTSRGWIHLIAGSGKAIAGEPINIIQHPGGERQQIAIRENKIVGPDGDFLIYTTDTKQGSSGSPATNDQWQLAALHHAGVPDKDSAGNWLRRDGGVFRSGIDDPDTIHWVANEGVRISRIVSAVRALGLSPAKIAIFDESFTPAPPALETLAAMGMRDDQIGLSGSNTPRGNSLPSSGMNVGPDGVARWDFQLSFGPRDASLGGTGESAGATVAAAASARPEPVDTIDTRLQESVFERRGPYLDEAAEADAIEEYYADIGGSLSKSKRFTALHELVKDSHENKLSYKSARHDHLYPWIDRREDETLRSIYSGDLMAEELFVAERLAVEAAIERAAVALETFVSALPAEVLEAEDAALEASSPFNCEHVVPQSWFDGEDEQRAQKSDLHHLFTCESGCNSFRSNIPYSEFTPSEEAAIRAKEVSAVEAILDPTLEAVRPQCGLRDGRRFEPTAGKGVVARATLYFVLRYPGVVGDVKSGNKKEFLKSHVGTLLDWAEAEQPSRYERHRNAEIAKVQGNRNPLIDRPDWLRRIAFEDGFG